jgi:hypothetical protein
MALSSRSTHTPWRLDLDWRWHQNALEYGCIFIINPDAHSIRELDHAHWMSKWPARAACRQIASWTPCPFQNACVSCETQTRGCKRLSSPCPLTGIFRAIDEHPARRIIAKNKRGHSPVPAQKRKYGSSPRAFRRTILEEKDHGAWSIPKGLISFGEAPLDTAKREFEEETGHRPRGEFTSLGEANHPRGKTAHVWAVEDGWNPDELKSNMFQME